MSILNTLWPWRRGGHIRDRTICQKPSMRMGLRTRRSMRYVGNILYRNLCSEFRIKTKTRSNTRSFVVAERCALLMAAEDEPPASRTAEPAASCRTASIERVCERESSHPPLPGASSASSSLSRSPHLPAAASTLLSGLFFFFFFFEIFYFSHE